MQFTQREIDQWREYEAVRESGEYNMFDPAARDETSLSRAEWLFCITHYDALKTVAES